MESQRTKSDMARRKIRLPATDIGDFGGRTAAPEPKTVLFAIRLVGEILPRIMSGVYRLAEARRWNLHTVVCTRDPDETLRFVRSPTSGSLADIFSLLKPDGVLDTQHIILPAEIRAAARAAGMRSVPPVVHLGEPEPAKGAVYVHGDPESFAKLALRELLQSGFRDFAYVPHSANAPWSVVRGEAFGRLVKLSGRRFHQCPVAAAASERGAGDDFHGEVSRFLEALPKPCGIFAANDIVGEIVLNAAHALGLGVPGEIAVVAVDDLAHVCEATRPTLSSVRRDLEEEGRAAADLLDKWLDAPSRPPRPLAVPAVSLVRRASTQFSALHDERVSRAQEFIRNHACEDGFSPLDAIRTMFLSRSAADHLFRRVAGRPILQEIHAVRIERAMEKLRAGMAPDVVAAECGYSSYLDFRRVFRRVVGIPVGAWTKAALKSKNGIRRKAKTGYISSSEVL